MDYRNTPEGRAFDFFSINCDCNDGRQVIPRYTVLPSLS